jgi:hypothetical protein
MELLWHAKRYKYFDGNVWNSGRYEIEVRQSVDQEWVSVGGAITRWGRESVAYLGTMTTHKMVKNLETARKNTDGLYVEGDTLREALMMLRWKYPDPQEILKEARRLALAAF